MNGIIKGYLYSSPLDAFILAIITHTNSRIIIAPNNTKPIMINISGMQIREYKATESWKFSAALPFWSTQSDSCFFDDQQISGPIIPPKGIIRLAKVER